MTRIVGSRTGTLASWMLAAAIAGCGGGGGAETDAGTRADTGGGADDVGVVDGGSTADTGGSEVDAGNTDVDAGGGGVDSGGGDVDGGSAPGGCLFAGRYVATNIRCNGVPFTGAGALTPPAGGWYAADDGTTATFTQTIGGCSLVATGHITCDSPMVGEFTHHPDAPLACEPAACTPFATACSGSAVGAEATWSYTRNADGSIEAATVGTTPIRTCTAVGQSNPVQITWVPAP